jgi:hypothetical protein
LPCGRHGALQAATPAARAVLGRHRSRAGHGQACRADDERVETYELDELLGTKLRALYQRKQARDLFDLEIALTRLPVEPQRIVAAFLEYMVRDGHPITRAQVEQNLALKMRDGAFLADLSPLLATGEAWDPIAAEALISERLVTLLPGDPWKGDDH